MNRVLVPQQLAPFSPPSRASGSVVRELNGYTMGTNWCVKLVVPSSAPFDRIQQEIQSELDRIVAEMSTWEPDSHLSRFNAAAAGTWVALPKDLFGVVEYALSVARDTAGAYDPSAGPLVNLWGFGPYLRHPEPPDPNAIEAARARTGWQRGRLDRTTRRAYQPGGWYLDLSSVAKGFAVDRVAAYLDANDVESYLVEIGGELKGRGAKPDGQPWWVTLERPDLPSETIVALHGLSVASSGDYRRFFEHNGMRYSHTIDPRTGYPLASGPASVTVLHSSCMAADALSTALMVLGSDGGARYARNSNIAALFVDRQGSGYRETMTPAFAAMLDE